MTKNKYVNDDIYQKLADKFNLPKSKIKHIIEEGFFKQINKEISSGNLNDIRIPYICSLRLNHKMFNKLNGELKINTKLNKNDN